MDQPPGGGGLYGGTGLLLREPLTVAATASGDEIGAA